MKFALLAAAAILSPAVASAQTAPAAPAQTAPAAKFNLDTPIEAIVADEKAHAVLTAAFEGNDVVANPNYDAFKGMSLNAVAAYVPDKLTPEALKKIEAALAEVK